MCEVKNHKEQTYTDIDERQLMLDKLETEIKHKWFNNITSKDNNHKTYFMCLAIVSASTCVTVAFCCLDVIIIRISVT